MQLLDIAVDIDDMWGEELNSKPISEVPETIDLSAELDVASSSTMNDVANSSTMNDVAETTINTPPELFLTFIIVLIALLLCLYFAIRYRRNHAKN
ncbi:MAG: hypothetical protein II597_13310 [Prevotella sp.]|nr:hypothetical protein [Prevotella sp.]